MRHAVQASSGLNRAAALLAALDAVPAIALAAGLAGALVSLAGGLVQMAPWLALVAGAAVVRAGLALGVARCGLAASVAVRQAVRTRTMAACLGLPPGRGRPVGELMVSAIDSVEALDGYVARVLPAQAAAAAGPLLVLGAVAAASPVSAAILAATMVPFVGFMILAGSAAADRARAQMSALTRLGGLFADRVRQLPLVLAYQAEEAEAQRLARAAEAVRRRTMAVLRAAFASSTGLDFFAALSVALVAVYAGFSLLGLLPFRVPEHLDLGRAFFVLALAPEFYAPMRRVAACYHDRRAAEAAADALMEIAALAISPSSLPPLERAPSIHFAGVGVRYPGEDRPALQDLEFTARPGEILALVGPSGSGKTTVLRLLLGLAPLAGGEVWIGDAALSGIGSVAPWIAWLGQSPLIVPGTLAENISLSRPGAERAELAAVARQAGLCAALRGRPGGLDAVVDERGSGLSGGERQRIALARTLLKQAPILLLDEPTAHLDAAGAAALIGQLRIAARGRTTIIATHSAALAAIADQVVRLERP